MKQFPFFPFPPTYFIFILLHLHPGCVDVRMADMEFPAGFLSRRWPESDLRSFNEVAAICCLLKISTSYLNQAASSHLCSSGMSVTALHGAWMSALCIQTFVLIKLCILCFVTCGVMVKWTLLGTCVWRTKQSYSIAYWQDVYAQLPISPSWIFSIYPHISSVWKSRPGACDWPKNSLPQWPKSTLLETTYHQYLYYLFMY